MNIRSLARKFVLNRIPQQTPEWISRGYTLFFILFLAIVFGALALIPSIISSIQEEKWIALLALSASYATILVILLMQNLSYYVRSYFLCFAITVVGIISINSIGIVSSARLWFLCSAVLACLLISGKFAFTIFIISFLILLGFGFKSDFVIKLPSEPDYIVWIITSTTFVLVNILVVGATYLIVSGLKKAEKKIRDSENSYRVLSEKLADRLRHEEVLASCSQDLLKGGEDAVQRVLERLLDATKVGRVHIFENFYDPSGGLCMRQKYETVAHGTTLSISSSLLQGLSYVDSGFGRWVGLLGKGKHIEGSTDTFPQSERSTLESLGIVSTLVLPITVGGKWWGFAGFDELYSKREWGDEEVRLLRVAAELIGSYIDRRLATEALRESEHRFRSFVENANDIVYSLSPEGVFTYVSPNWSHFMGEPATEAVGSAFEPYVHPEDISLCREFLERVLVTGEKQSSVEYRVKHRNGSWRWHVSNGSPMFDMDGNVISYFGIARDITERKRTEENREKLQAQLNQTRKIESIGTLAGGVAHDLNNLLSPILGYSEILRDDFDPEDARRESVNEIISAGLRARDLVRQLLAFSRKQILEFKPVGLNKVAVGLEKLLRHTIREDIEMEFDLRPDTGLVMADTGQIEQVIMNLSVNAADAMPEGGKLTVETGKVYLDEEYTKHHQSAKPGEHAVLAISDTGCGMDESTRERIFDPFFSTKGEHGTGLGLATVYGIVKQHGGNIWVYSEPGKGSTFKIYLPIVKTSQPEETTAEETSKDLRGSETILIVEDSEQVRVLAGSVLERNGYHVLTAGNGAEALQTVESHDGPVHLLLTDVVLPGMNGRELYEKAAETRPSIKVLYMSGYTDNVIAHRGVLDEGVQFIQKPFTVQGLAAKVREVLDGAWGTA